MSVTRKGRPHPGSGSGRRVREAKEIVSSRSAGTWPHPRIDGAVTAGGEPGAHRAGRESLPARLGGVFPLRECGSAVHADDGVRRDACSAVVGEAGALAASAAASPVRLGRASGSGAARWMGRLPAAEPAVAGEGERRPVKDVGEPCAGEPHARFEGEGLETGVGYGTWK